MINIIEDFFNKESKHPAFTELQKSIKTYKNIQISQVAGALSSIILLLFYRKTKANKGIYIANNEDDALQIYNNLDYWIEQLQLNDKIYLQYLPSSYKNFDTFSINSSNEAMRLQCSELFADDDIVSLVITYPEAIVEKIPKSENIIKNKTKLKIGDRVDLNFLIELLLYYGYVEVDYVYEPGQFALRGAICDIYPFNANAPYRLLFKDETLSHVKLIDVVSQMSIQELTCIDILVPWTSLIKLKFLFFNF